MAERRHGGIILTIDHDRITLQMPGVFAHIIKRPPTVSTTEWEEFWGGIHPEFKEVPGSDIR